MRSSSAARRWLDGFEPQMRLTLGLGVVLVALYSVASGLFWAGLALLPALWAVADAVRQGSVWTAFAAFRAGRLSEANRLTDQVLWPALLAPAARAYYHWLRGALASGDERWEAARVYLLAAVAGPLRTENDRALVHTLLAEVALRRHVPEEARQHLDLADALAAQPGTRNLITTTRVRILPSSNASR